MAINIIYQQTWNTEESATGSSVFTKENFKFSFKTLLKLFNTEGNLAYEYNPFRNFRSKYDLYLSDALGNLIDSEGNKIYWLNSNYYLTKNNITNFIEVILPSNPINILTASLNTDEITTILQNVNNVSSPVWVVQRANSLLDFETNLLDLSIKNSLQIECQPSYDGSVNLILNDNKNQPRLINSRFTVLQNDTYKIVDRKGDNDTNIYDDKSFNNDISLYKRINSIPKIEFLGLKYGGNFSVGNFVFYFKYCDADGNETDFLEESGIVTTHIGNINSPFSIRSGIANENSRKMIEFSVSNIDQNYDFLKIYYTRSYSDETSGELTDAFIIDRNFPIKGKSLNIVLTGYDKAIPVPIQTINAQYTIANSAKTQCQVQNRLFMANIYKPSINYKELEDLSLRIFPNAKKVSKIGRLDEYYSDLSLKYEYYNTKNIYYNLGIWDSEIYRFGIVYIMKDYTLSPVFNVRGRNNLFIDNTTTTTDYINKNFLNKDVYDDSGKRIYLEINENNFELAGSIFDMDNSKGVSRFSENIVNRELLETEPIGVQFIIPEDVLIELKNNTLGYFIVRQKRIPTILAQAFTIGWDKESYLPTINAKVANSNNSEFIIESFMNSSRDLTHDFASRIRKVPINLSTSKLKAITAICPEFELKQPYFNELFTGENFPVSESSIQPSENFLVSSIGSPRHFYSPKYIYKTTNSGITQNIKIVSVADDTKLKTNGSNKFSARAGDASEAFRYSQIGNENNSTDNANIVRGSFGPFLGIQGYQSIGKIINIHIPGYSLDRMNEYFRIRYEDSSPYFAISSRELFNDMIPIEGTKEYTTDILYRGDCFIGNYTHRMCRNFQDPEVPVNDSIIQPNTWKDNFKYGDPASYSKINRADVNAVQIGHWVTIRYMSNTNLSMRNTDNSRPSEEALFGSPRTFYPLYGFSTTSETKIPESFVVNSGHSSTTSDRYNFIIPDVPYLKNEYDARILFSDIHVNDSFKNGFRVFNTANYVDYPRIYGGITKIVPFRNNIIVVFEHGVALVPVNERAQVSDASGGPVYLTSPEDRVLPANFQILDPNFGSSWIDSIIVTPQAVFGVDTVAKKIWQTDGEKFSTISDFKFQKFLNDNISLKERENEMILGVRNVKTHYNNFKKDVIFTFYDDLYGTQETVWSLCYNLISESFITFYSWVPSFMANINNMPFSFDRNVSKLISKLSLSNINSKDADGIVLTSNIITKNSTKIGNLDLINRSFAFPKNVIVKKQFVLLKDNWNNYSNFVIKYNSGIYELHYKDSVQYETIKALNTSSILLNIECKVSLENYDVNDPDTAYYLNNFKDYYTVNYGQLENTIAVIAEENLLNTETYFWKHGQAGQFDIADDILPTVWYGKQHPFEFEFIVADKPSYQKIFDNLQILSNKAEPESFHYEIVGESYDFSEDKKNMYFRQEATNELFQNLGSDISYNKNYKRLVPEKLVKSNYLSLYYKREDSLNEIYDFYKTATSQGKDYSNLTGSEIVYDKLMNEFRISVHSKAQDIQKYGRSRGNMQYKEDLWAIEIAPLAFNTKNETWAEPFITNNFSGKEAIKVPPIILNYLPEDSTQYVIFPEDLPNNVGCSKCSKVFTYGFNDLVTNTSSWSTLKEAKIRDKYIKIRIRYSGKDLAVISNIITSYTISYS